jgi:alkaline phosphatase
MNSKKTNRYLLLFVFCSLLFCSWNKGMGQNSRKVNAHSHNDYEQQRPFALAYENRFGSIEADIWLKDGLLVVAHDAKDIDPNKTLSVLYLDPLVKRIEENRGHVYPDKKKELQLLIDIKSDAIATLNTLILELKKYPSLIHNKNLRFVISGNRPQPSDYANYPSFIYFDGRPAEQYDKKALKKVGLISENYYKFAMWNGKGEIADNQRAALLSVINKAHEMGKPFRFWATPDTEASWKIFMELGVDYINTDKVEALADFLKR